jgi:hypothetical protein
VVEDIESRIELIEGSSEKQRKLLKSVKEFGNYISANKLFIPNHSDRYRHGETISTAFVESAVNYVVSKRMVKKQQMRYAAIYHSSAGNAPGRREKLRLSVTPLRCRDRSVIHLPSGTASFQ